MHPLPVPHLLFHNAQGSLLELNCPYLKTALTLRLLFINVRAVLAGLPVI